MVIHWVALEVHGAREGESQSLGIEDGSIWRETDQWIRNRNVLEQTGFEVPYEQIRSPDLAEQVVIQCKAIIETYVNCNIDYIRSC